MMRYNWNKLKFPNYMQLERYTEKIISDNANEFVRIILNEMMSANFSLVKMMIPLLVKSISENVLHSFQVAILLKPAASRNNVEAMFWLLHCFAVDPVKCVIPLSEAIIAYDKKISTNGQENDKISNLIKYQLAFCYTFGIGISLCHSKAVSYLEDIHSSLLEAEILWKFLKASSDNPTINGGSYAIVEFDKLCEDIDKREKDHHRKDYLLAFYTVLKNSFIQGFISPNLGAFLSYKRKKLDAARITINLLEAYKASQELKDWMCRNQIYHINNRKYLDENYG